MGCGLHNVHLFYVALSRQTMHVQFVVFEREDKNIEQPKHLLRDVNSFFLLAYFFPGCEDEDQSKGMVNHCENIIGHFQEMTYDQQLFIYADLMYYLFPSNYSSNGSSWCNNMLSY